MRLGVRRESRPRERVDLTRPPGSSCCLRYPEGIIRKPYHDRDVRPAASCPASSTALRTPIFSNTRARWTSTVRMAMPSSSAICLLSLPCEQQVDHFPLPVGQAVARGGRAPGGVVGLLRCSSQGGNDDVDQVVVVEWLLDEVVGAAFSAATAIGTSPCPVRNITGSRLPSSRSRSNSSSPPMPSMRMSSDDAAVEFVPPRRDERLAGGEAARLELARGEQPGERIADRLVVVDDVRPRRGRRAHCVPTIGRVKRNTVPAARPARTTAGRRGARRWSGRCKAPCPCPPPWWRRTARTTS